MCIYIYICIHVYIYIYICVYICVYICICMYVCVYIYIYMICCNISYNMQYAISYYDIVYYITVYSLLVEPRYGPRHLQEAGRRIIRRAPPVCKRPLRSHSTLLLDRSRSTSFRDLNGGPPRAWFSCALRSFRWCALCLFCSLCVSCTFTRNLRSRSRVRWCFSRSSSWRGSKVAWENRSEPRQYSQLLCWELSGFRPSWLSSRFPEGLSFRDARPPRTGPRKISVGKVPAKPPTDVTYIYIYIYILIQLVLVLVCLFLVPVLLRFLEALALGDLRLELDLPREPPCHPQRPLRPALTRPRSMIGMLYVMLGCMLYYSILH